MDALAFGPDRREAEEQQVLRPGEIRRRPGLPHEEPVGRQHDDRRRDVEDVLPLQVGIRPELGAAELRRSHEDGRECDREDDDDA